MEDEVDWGVEEEDFDPWAIQTSVSTTSLKKDKGKEADISSFEGKGGGQGAGKEAARDGQEQVAAGASDKNGDVSNGATENARSSVSIPLSATPSTFTPAPSSTTVVPSANSPADSTPSITPDDLPPMPKDWILKPSRNKQGRAYYYNTITKATSWDRPSPPEEEEADEPSTPPLPAADMSGMDVDVEAIPKLNGSQAGSVAPPPDTNDQARRNGREDERDTRFTQRTLLINDRRGSRDHVDVPLAPRGPRADANGSKSSPYYRGHGHRGGPLDIIPRSVRDEAELTSKSQHQEGDRSNSNGGRERDEQQGTKIATTAHKGGTDVDVRPAVSVSSQTGSAPKDDTERTRRDPTKPDSYIPARQYDTDRRDRPRDPRFRSRSSTNDGERKEASKTPRTSTDVTEKPADTRGPPGGAWGRDARNRETSDKPSMYPSRDRAVDDKPIITPRSSTGGDTWGRDKKRSSDAMDVDRPSEREERINRQVFADGDNEPREDRFREQQRSDLRRPRQEEGPKYGQAPAKRLRENDVQQAPLFKRRDEEAPPGNGSRIASGSRGDDRGSRDMRKDPPPHDRDSRAIEDNDRGHTREQLRFPERPRDATTSTDSSRPPFTPTVPDRVLHRNSGAGADSRHASSGLQTNYSPIVNSRWGKPVEAADTAFKQDTPVASERPASGTRTASSGRPSFSDAFPDAARSSTQADRELSSARSKTYNFAPMAANDERMREPAPPAPIETPRYPNRNEESRSERRAQDTDSTKSVRQSPHVRDEGSAHPNTSSQAIPSGPRADYRAQSDRGPNNRAAEQQEHRNSDYGRSLPTGRNGANHYQVSGRTERKRSPELQRPSAAPAPAVVSAAKPGPYVNPARAHLVQQATPAAPPAVFAKPAPPAPSREPNIPSGPRASGSDDSRTLAGYGPGSGQPVELHRSASGRSGSGSHRGGRGSGFNETGPVDSGWKSRGAALPATPATPGTRQGEPDRGVDGNGREGSGNLLHRIGDRDGAGSRAPGSRDSRWEVDDRRSGAPNPRFPSRS